MDTTTKEVSNLSTKKISDAVELYTDTIDVGNQYNRNKTYQAANYSTQTDVLTALNQSDADPYKLIDLSSKLYATDASYKKIIDYYATIYDINYYVVPRKINSKKEDKLDVIYPLMIEIADGLSLDTKIPNLLINLFKKGGVYFIIYFSKESNSVNTLILPNKFTKRVGETELGTDVIKLDVSYFDNLGLTPEQIKATLETFPDIITKAYKNYKKGEDKWQLLDSRYASCVLLNEKSIPTLLNAYGAILNYQSYCKNEVDRNTQELSTIIEHHIPTFQDKLLLEMPEMTLLHKKLANIVKSTKNSRLVTTIGDIKVHPLLTSTEVNNETLLKAYKSIFDTVGLNESLFTGDSQFSLNASKANDQAIVWYYIEKFVNFYNFAINNLMDFKGYQLEITVLPIPHDGAKEAIASYRENAKVGVGILPFIVASGIKQKNIDSLLALEEKLQLSNRLKPLMSSNTTSGAVEQSNNDVQSSTGDSKNGQNNN